MGTLQYRVYETVTCDHPQHPSAPNFLVGSVTWHLYDDLARCDCSVGCCVLLSSLCVLVVHVAGCACGWVVSRPHPRRRPMHACCKVCPP